MAQIVPTVTAYSQLEYDQQVQRIAPFTKRVHLDLMDGEFAPTTSVPLKDLWWPHSFHEVDVHMMYQRPMEHLEALIHLQPHMVIIHVETMFHHMHFAAELHKENIKVGLSIMPDTPVANIEQIINSFDHLLIFSGNLGHYGGHANLDLLEKVQQAKAHHPDLEIGWDGGINLENAKQLADGGIDVLNVGGAVQKADNPALAYKQLTELISK